MPNSKNTYKELMQEREMEKSTKFVKPALCMLEAMVVVVGPLITRRCSNMGWPRLCILSFLNILSVTFLSFL